MMISRSSRQKHEQKGAKMAQEGNASFQEVFTMASMAESVKLLPWCVSSVAPRPQEPPALGPSSSPGHLSETPPAVIPLLPDLLFMGTSPVLCLFAEFLAIYTQKKWGHSSSSSLDHHHGKRTYVDSQEVKAGSYHSSTWGDDNMPEPIPEARPSSEH